MKSISSRETLSYKRFISFVFLTTLFLITPLLLSAQDISSIDFRSLKSDELSDEQISQLYQRIESEGLSIAELEVIARARGMSPVEVSKLKSRINKVQQSNNSSTVQNTDDSRLRSMNNPDNEMQEPPEATNVFGSKIFNNNKLTFEPSLNLPTPKNYILGPGDELIVDIWGAAENTYQLTISPEGSIRIPKLGPLYLSGLSIDEASNQLITKLSTIYSGLEGSNKNTYAQVSLGKLRSIQVNIIGNVYVPGTYTLTSFATVLNALYYSGGPTEKGTFRKIKIIRNGTIFAEVDLYDFIVEGDLTSNITLQDQDIIKVDPYENRITIIGETKRTGFFESIENETFESILNFAGGFNEFAFKKRITVERNTDTEKSIVNINYPEEKNTILKNGDILTFGKILSRYDNRIIIEGAVFRPGFYELSKNLTLSALIKNAEGIMGDAFLERAIIYRTKADYSIEAIAVNLGAILKDPLNNDLELQKEDRIKISSIFDLRENRTVNINGSILSPGTFDYVEGLTLKDLIFKADGFKENAAPYNIEIARRIVDKQTLSVRNEIAEIISVNLDNGLNYQSKLEEILLEPFDEVFIRKSPAYETQKLITITGEVNYPGIYALETRDFKISNLINISGGTTEFAYIEGASLERKFELNKNELELNLADSLIEEAEEIESLSKVGINLKDAIENPNSTSNILLQEGDIVHIPKKLETVQVRGEVLYPINIRFNVGNKYKNYINSAGGYTDLANKKRAYIVYANGDVDRTKKFLFFKSYPKVKPGAILIIPPKQEKKQLSTAERITLYSTIVSLAAIVTNTIFQIRNSK